MRTSPKEIIAAAVRNPSSKSLYSRRSAIPVRPQWLILECLHGLQPSHQASVRFARGEADFPKGAILYLAKQTRTNPSDPDGYGWAGRSNRRHLAEMLDFLGIRRLKQHDLARSSEWMPEHLKPLGMPTTMVADCLVSWFAEQKIACPADAELDRLIKTFERRFEGQVLDTVPKSFSSTQMEQLNISLMDEDPVTGFSGLKADPGQATLDNILLIFRAIFKDNANCSDGARLNRYRNRTDRVRRSMQVLLASTCALCVLGTVPVSAQDIATYLTADGNKTSDRDQAISSWRADAEFNGNWGLKAINADAAYVLGHTGFGSRIGVIDAPVWGPHPEFSATVGSEGKLTFMKTSGTYTYADPYITTRKPGIAFTYDGAMYVDGYGSVAGHGTHVAGIAAANRDTTAGKASEMQGVAYNARLFAADNGDPGPEDGIVLGNDGGAYAAAWQAMIDSNVNVITNSWGIGISESSWRYTQAAGQFKEIQAILGTSQGGAYDGVIKAAKSGIVIEFSAGNDSGADPDAMAGLAAFIPELEENWIATMSVAQNLRRSSFSSICGYTKYFCVAAPGSNIYSATVEADLTGKQNGDMLADAEPNHGNGSGTSMAGPFVSGSIGVLKERFSYLSNGELNTILKTTSKDLGEAGVDAVFGWGLINLEKAMNGPGQFLGQFEAKLSAGLADTWSNDISDAASQQRQAEELAEIEDWTDHEAELEGKIQTVPEVVATKAEDIAAMEQARALLKVAVDLKYRDTYVPADFDAAIEALEAAPVGRQLLAAFEAADPGWINRYSARGDYESFINERSDTELAESLAKADRNSIIAANDAINLEIETGKVRIDQLSQKTDADYLGILVKSGGGVLTLTGDNNYRGDTTIDGGLLVVDGSLVSRTVINGGGTLGGTGSVGQLLAMAGGIVSPGNSIGTLTVIKAGAVGEDAGHVTFEKGSALAIEVAADGRSDRLVVEGKTTLLGGVVLVSLENSGGPESAAELAALSGNRYTILSSGGGVSGMFDEVVAYYTFIDTSLIYGTDYVDLMIGRRAFADAADTFNEDETTAAIEALGGGNEVYKKLLGLTVNDDVSATLAGFSGEIHASLKSVLIEDGRFLRDAANSRVRATLGGISTTTAANNPEEDNRLAPAIWGQAFGSWGSFDSDGNAGDLDRDIGGFIAGVDGDVANNWRLGLIVGYAGSTLDAAAASADIDSYQIGLYGGTRWDAVGLSFGAAYGHHDIETTRSTLAGATTGDYSTDSVQLFGEAGYTFDTAFAAIEPFAGLAYTHLETDDFDEDGGAAALSGFGDSTDVTTTTLGLRASRQFSVGNGSTIRASGMIGWQHASGDVTPEAGLAFGGGDTFLNKGLPIAGDALALEADFEVDLSANVRLGLHYNGQVSDNLVDNSVKANLSVKF